MRRKKSFWLLLIAILAVLLLYWGQKQRAYKTYATQAGGTKTYDRHDALEHVRGVLRAQMTRQEFLPGVVLGYQQDIVVDELVSVGPEHVDVLLEVRQETEDMLLRSDLLDAIGRLIDDTHKDVILDHLNADYELIKIIMEQGWEEDASEILLQELDDPHYYLPRAWIRAVARLNDPDTYEALKRYFVCCPHRRATFNAIKNLPGMELRDAVAKAWQRAKAQREGEYVVFSKKTVTTTRYEPAIGSDGNLLFPEEADEILYTDETGRERIAYAVYPRWEMRKDYIRERFLDIEIIAAQFGHLDALQGLIQALTKGTALDERSRVRSLIRELTEANGTDEEIYDWFQLNRDVLSFDRVRGKYVRGRD